MIKVDYEIPTKYRTVSMKIMDIEHSVYILSLFGDGEGSPIVFNRMYVEGDVVKFQFTFNKMNYLITYDDKIILSRVNNKTQVSDKCEITRKHIEDGSFVSIFDPVLSKQNINDLKTKGYTLITNLFNEYQLRNMEHHLHLIDMKKSNIVKGDSSYRTDKIQWLNEENSAFEGYILSRFERLKQELNQTCFFNLKGIESHFAQYSNGSKYGRHLDALKKNNKRKVSAVTYLNRYWNENNGGYLRLYVNGEVVDIEPKFPTTVLFLSEEIEHEVLETFEDRFSIATWFRN